MCQVEVRSATPADASAISWLLAETLRDSYTELLSEDELSQLVHRHCSLERIKAEVGIPGGVPGWLGWLVAVAQLDSEAPGPDGSTPQRASPDGRLVGPSGAPRLSGPSAPPGGDVLGAAAGGIPAPESGEVYALGVSPRRRREGIGSRLLEALTERQRTHGAQAQAVTLPCEPDPAFPFFDRHGYTGSGPRLSRPL